MNKDQTTSLALALLLVAILAVGVYAVRKRTAQRASELLAARLTPDGKTKMQIQFRASNL